MSDHRDPVLTPAEIRAAIEVEIAEIAEKLRAVPIDSLSLQPGDYMAMARAVHGMIAERNTVILEQSEALVEAIRAGWRGLDALHRNRP